MQVKTKKYYISLIIAIVGLLSIISGSSYAILKGSSTASKEQVIKSGNLELTLTEHFETMNKPLSVLKDEDGLLQEETYSFNVKNTGSGTAKYNLKLVSSTPSSYTGSLIDDKYIKIGIEVNGKEKGPYTLSEVNNIIDKEVIYKKEIVPYKLRIWLNSAKENELENLEDAKVYLKLELEIEQSMGENSNLDKSGANKPVLSDNMIPVYYDETKSVWKKADVKNIDSDYRWYDYNNKIWANAVTVTEKNRSKYLEATSGTEIPMDDINTMWVWIPRYTYTYLNTNTPEEIKIKFEKGTNSSGTISCTDTATGTSSTSEECTDTTNGSLKAGTSTYTHPAFWWDKNDNSTRESGEGLSGIWVGKFETGTDQIIKPNVVSLRETTVSTFYTNIYNMRSTGNNFGFSGADETHMMKNMEWGAVAYLAHSKYGRCTDGTCEEVTKNNCNSYITGIGGDTGTQSSTTCTTDANKYNGEKGVLASTTGNVYGIYDMNGGAFEYVMGNLANSSGEMYSSSSGFSTYPNKRYYDKYSYGTSSTEYTRGKLGDASIEMIPTGASGNWYSDHAYFPNSSNSWFLRGGLYYNGSNAGLFNFSGFDGDANRNYSTRAVISNLS